MPQNGTCGLACKLPGLALCFVASQLRKSRFGVQSCIDVGSCGWKPISSQLMSQAGPFFWVLSRHSISQDPANNNVVEASFSGLGSLSNLIFLLDSVLPAGCLLLPAPAHYAENDTDLLTDTKIEQIYCTSNHEAVVDEVLSVTGDVKYFELRASVLGC